MTSLHDTQAFERRRKPRIYNPFPAVVRGVDKDGNAFEVRTVLDNLSADGLYLRIMPVVKNGSRLTVTFELSSPSDEVVSANVRVQSRVVRTDHTVGGSCGVAVTYTSPKFL